MLFRFDDSIHISSESSRGNKKGKLRMEQIDVLGVNFPVMYHSCLGDCLTFFFYFEGEDVVCELDSSVKLSLFSVADCGFSTCTVFGNNSLCWRWNVSPRCSQMIAASSNGFYMIKTVLNKTFWIIFKRHFLLFFSLAFNSDAGLSLAVYSLKK